MHYSSSCSVDKLQVNPLLDIQVCTLYIPYRGATTAMCTAKPGKTPITRRHTTAAAATRSYWSYPLWIPWGILLLVPNEWFPKFATGLNVRFTTTSGNFFANLQRSSGGHIEALNRYLSSVILYSKIYPWYFMQVDTVDAGSWFFCLIYLILKLQRCICIDSDEMNQRNWIISTTNHPISTYDILKWKWDWCQMFYSFSLFFPSFFAAIIIGFMYTLVVLIKVHYLISINQLDNHIWWIITEALTFSNFSIGHFVIGRWCQSLWCSFQQTRKYVQWKCYPNKLISSSKFLYIQQTAQQLRPANTPSKCFQ